jgi:asparagine synthetase B (glutamine-hydrolysing)
LAGFIIACSRRDAAPPWSADALRRCALHLSPEGITPNPPDIHEEAGLARAVVNPVPGVRVHPQGVCLGALFEDAAWSTVGGESPDGTYAIVRHDDQAVELLSDTFGSRTVWYVHTDTLFLASTSQRALVVLLGDFVPRAETATWLLAAGNLGPDCGWDERLRRLPIATRLRLDRRTWTVDSVSEETTYVPRALPPEEHLSRLRDAIFTVCAGLDVEHVSTALTLSGGCDSRSILVGLAHAARPVTCVTWGLAASLDDPRNDAFIARLLAERFGMRHEYLHLDFTDEPVRDVFSRFLRAGEGRIEDFSGYTDGFATWRRLVADGFSTMLRGDCPGWGSPYDPIDETVARSINMHCTLVSDYPEGHLIHRLGLAGQRRPEAFYQRDGETLPQYRDRLYNDFELPTCMAAFNDVKCAYLEVVNPLLGRDVVRVTTELPDELRHLRVGFERLAGSLVPDVPFADHPADEQPGVYLGRPRVREELLRELASEDARRVLPDAALAAIVADLERPLGATKARLRGRVKAVVPHRLIRAVRPSPRPATPTPRLAFRAYLASRMHAILREDARALGQREGLTPSVPSQ